MIELAAFLFSFMSLNIVTNVMAAQPAPVPSPSPTPTFSPSPSPSPSPTPAPSLSPSSANANPVIDHADNNTLYFVGTGPGAPKPLVLDLFNIQPIGALKPLPGGETEFLVRASSCRACKQEPALFVVPASGAKPLRIVEPGRVLDLRSRAVMLESRVFYGHCLKFQPDDVVVVFQRERIDRRKQPQPSVLIVQPEIEQLEGGKTRPHVRETLLERHMPRIDVTLKLARTKACHEVDTRQRFMPSHAPDIHLKRQKALEEEDEDDDSSPSEENPADADAKGP